MKTDLEKAPISDEFLYGGRWIKVIWRDAGFIPPQELITQASGVCFCEDGRVVLVRNDQDTWTLVGGHPEAGETAQEAFIREVAEEACADVIEMRFLGSQEVHDPGDPDNRPISYQTRFWARVNLRKFDPRFEIVERKLFDLTEVRTVITWHTKNNLDMILRKCEEIQRKKFSGTNRGE